LRAEEAVVVGSLVTKERSATAMLVAPTTVESQPMMVFVKIVTLTE
jgi:hypothetical protein